MDSYPNAVAAYGTSVVASDDAVPDVIGHFRKAPDVFYWMWLVTTITTILVGLLSVVHTAKLLRVSLTIRREKQLVFLPTLADVYLKIFLFFPLIALLTWSSLLAIRFAVMFQLLLHLYEVGCLLWFWELMAHFLGGPEMAYRLLHLTTSLTPEIAEKLVRAATKLHSPTEKKTTPITANRILKTSTIANLTRSVGCPSLIKSYTGLPKPSSQIREPNVSDTAPLPSPNHTGVEVDTFKSFTATEENFCVATRQSAFSDTEKNLPDVKIAMAECQSLSHLDLPYPSAPKDALQDEQSLKDQYLCAKNNCTPKPIRRQTLASSTEESKSQSITPYCQEEMNAHSTAATGAGGASSQFNVSAIQRKHSERCLSSCAANEKKSNNNNNNSRAELQNASTPTHMERCCLCVKIKQKTMVHNPPNVPTTKTLGAAATRRKLFLHYVHRYGGPCGIKQQRSWLQCYCKAKKKQLYVAPSASPSSSLSLDADRVTFCSGQAESSTVSADTRDTLAWSHYLTTVQFGPYRILAVFPLCCPPFFAAKRSFNRADLRLSYALVVQYFVFALLAALSRAISQGLVLFFQVLSLMSLYVAMYGLLLLFKATRRIIPRQECQLEWKLIMLKTAVFLMKGTEMLLRYTPIVKGYREPYGKTTMAHAWGSFLMNMAVVPIALISVRAFSPDGVRRRYSMFHERRSDMLIALLSSTTFLDAHNEAKKGSTDISTVMVRITEATPVDHYRETAEHHQLYGWSARRTPPNQPPCWKRLFCSQL